MARQPASHRQLILHSGIALGLLALSSYLSLRADDPSWFSLLLLYTIYLGLYQSSRLALASTIIFPLYSFGFSTIVGSAGFTTEFFFVILIWLAVGCFISRIRALYERARRQEAQLEENARFHRQIVENSTLGIFKTDMEGTLTFCNSQMVQLFNGGSKEELLGTSVFGFLVPERQQLEEAVTASAQSELVIRDFQYRARRLDGSSFYAELNGQLARDQAGNATGFVGLLQDVTEKTQAHRRAQRFRAILDETRDAILIHSLEEGKIIDVNRTTCEISGFSRDELLDNSIFDFDLGPTSREEYLEAVQREGYARFTTFNRCKDGSSLPVEVELSIIELDQERYLLAMVRDIRERIDLKAKNEERRQYLEGILRSSSSAIVTLDEEHSVEEWNPGAEQLFGYSTAEVVGRNIDSLIAGGNETVREEARGFTRRVSEGAVIPHTATVRFKKDGSPVEVIVAAEPIRIGGRIVGFVGTYTDISRQKAAETQVKQLLDEKESLLREVHHRIKNHMNIIRSLLSLQRKRISNPEAGDVLQEAESRLALMQDIYHKLYTRDDMTSIDLRELITDVVNGLIRSYANELPVRVHTEIEELRVSSRLSLPVGIIVNELLTNSFKYAFPEGRRGNVTVSLKALDAETVEIVVADDGRGMAPGEAEGSNYGFGLTLVQNYARQFDGTMEIDRSGGTRVTVRLLRDEPPLPPAH
jgi:PAS domain S-box-containing protein